METIYQEVIRINGSKKQIGKAIEELTELSLVLQHFLDNKATEKEVITEIADVSIITDQLKLIFDPENNTVNKEIAYKLGRLDTNLKNRIK